MEPDAEERSAFTSVEASSTLHSTFHLLYVGGRLAKATFLNALCVRAWAWGDFGAWGRSDCRLGLSTCTPLGLSTRVPDVDLGVLVDVGCGPSDCDSVVLVKLAVQIVHLSWSDTKKGRALQ